MVAALARLAAAHAQLPNGNTGLGDAQAKGRIRDLPTWGGIPSASNRGGYGTYEGRSGYYGTRPYWRGHYWHLHSYYGRRHDNWW
jgi:hypothetical protein